MFRVVVLLSFLAAVVAFGPSRMQARSMSMKLDLQSTGAKLLVAAGLGLSVMGPLPVLADGAVSASTVYRARNSYGAKIMDLQEAVSKGNFAAFDNKKVLNAFDLFISGSNAKGGIKGKETKKAELALQAKIYDAVKAKNAGALKSAYDEFIKLADLKSEYKPGEVGQTDSSGFSPTWGTERQYIYQR